MTDRHSGAASAIKFIEFVGLPGAGKTTVAARLETALRDNGIRTVSRSVVLADNSPFIWRQCRRLLIVTRNISRCWHLYYLSLKLILASGQKSVRDMVKVTWNVWSVLALMANSRAAGHHIVVVDQGLLQAVWSIQLRSTKALSFDSWSKLLLTAGITDILFIHIQSEIAIARNRVSTRVHKGTRLDPRAQEDIADRWLAASANMTNLIHLTHGILPHDQAEYRLITVGNNSISPEGAAAEIVSAFLAQENLAQDQNRRAAASVLLR